MISLILFAALGASAQVQTCPNGEHVLMDGRCSETWGCGGCLDRGDNIKFSPLILTFVSPLAAPQENNVYGAGWSTAALGTAIPRPDAKMTPGATNPALTKQKLCSKSFHTGSVRHVTPAAKRYVCEAYSVAGTCPGPGWELDHLIPLELGGSNDIANLWPQPEDRRGVIGFHAKDSVEKRAHAAVCRPGSTLTLEDAQKGIASDWYGFGIKYGFIPR